MKATHLICLILPLTIIACAPAPIIYQPSDKSGEPTGKVDKLKMLLPDKSPVRLVFVHGVGDHCPGYALDSRAGWLSTQNAAAMGLFPVPNPRPGHNGVSQFIDVSVYMEGIRDGLSGVSYATKDFVLKMPGREDIAVEAIEITWSSLTQWIKSNQLGYDSPLTSTDRENTRCLQPAGKEVPPTVQAPWRVPINKKIKEQVFDRNLADAVLYAGTYRETMERGLAEGLCHAITSTSKDVKCVWPSAENESATKLKNLFVTHSLGSRMTYDMFLDLTSTAEKNIFPPKERDNARPFIQKMLENTPAIYMMANQLALLGLANVPPGIRSFGKTPRPLSLISPQHALSSEAVSGLSHPGAVSKLEQMELRSEPPGVPESPITPNAPIKATMPAVPTVFGDVLLKIRLLKERVAEETRIPVTKLEIVSFNDTNDLLTWHIPRWYDSGEAKPTGEENIHVTDVFVHNSIRWFYLFENPAGAHLNYFNNSDVRDVILCGADQGKVSGCQN